MHNIISYISPLPLTTRKIQLEHTVKNINVNEIYNVMIKRIQGWTKHRRRLTDVEGNQSTHHNTLQVAIITYTPFLHIPLNSDETKYIYHDTLNILSFPHTFSSTYLQVEMLFVTCASSTYTICSFGCYNISSDVAITGACNISSVKQQQQL
jgi:hypothetical protein